MTYRYTAITPYTVFVMFKKILIVVFLVGIGYALAVFVPMPADWAGDMKQPFQADGVIGDSFIGEYVGVLPGGEVPEAEAVEEDTTQYARQSDLLVMPQEAAPTYTIMFGQFADDVTGAKWLDKMGFDIEPAQYIPYKDPLNNKSVLALVGQFADEAEAQAKLTAWESTYDMSLLIVKFPVFPDPEAEAKAQQDAELKAQQEQNAQAMAAAFKEVLEQQQSATDTPNNSDTGTD